MNLVALSQLIFSIGRRYPRFPLAFVRTIPLKLFREMRRPGLRETFRRASRAPYYQEAFARAGIEAKKIRYPEDLGDFFLTADVLKSKPESLLCGTPELAIESSGTSGRISKVYLSHKEMEYNAFQSALIWALYGLNREDRMICTLDLAFGLGALLAERGVRYMQMFAMVVGRVDPLEAYRRLAEYRFNVVVSDPFWMVRLTEIAREHGRPGPLKLLIGGGEGVTDRTRSDLEQFWDAKLCMTYASTEAATILAFECLSRTGYHVNEFDFYLEIDRPDEEGYGEIVFTTVNRRVMPLVRYRTGDVARWLPGSCPCRLPFRRISPLRGRLDEQVSCAWGNVHPDLFRKILGTIPGLANDWQVALLERNGKQTFQFRLEHQDGASGRDNTGKLILKAIESQEPSAWQTYVQKLADIEFVFYPKGTLRKGRKLLSLVDERNLANGK